MITEDPHSLSCAGFSRYVDFSQAHGSAFVNPSGMKKQQKKTKKT
jgi:hypothetical protein